MNLLVSLAGAVAGAVNCALGRHVPAPQKYNEGDNDEGTVTCCARCRRELAEPAPTRS